MDNLINRPSSSTDKMSGADFRFKIPVKPKPVAKPVLRLENSFRKNTSNSLPLDASTLLPSTSSSSTNFSVPRLGSLYRSNTSSLSASIMPSTSAAEGSIIKIPRLGNQYRNNASNLFPLEASTSTTIMPSSSTSAIGRDSLTSGNKSLFSSGLDLVNRGTFKKNNFSNNRIRQQPMLPDSSRMVDLVQDNDDNQSVTGSVMSTFSNVSVLHSFKNKLKNNFESMESVIKRNCTSISQQDLFIIQTLMRRQQEAFFNDMQKEFSMAMSFRDVDGCSTFNDTAKTLCGLISKNESQIQNFSAIKSSKEVLSEVQCNSQTSFQRKEFQFITNFQTSRRDDDNMILDECDENNETVLFRKPKVPKIMVKKTQVTEAVVYQKKPAKGNQNSKDVIYLQKWFPVAVGTDLKFSGMNNEKQPIETKAIKKRIDNRTVELIDGKKCIIEGSPNSSIVSSFPNNIVQKLKNGLHARWKVLQKDISNCQKNFSSISKSKNKEPDKRHLQIEYTPRTRKIAKQDESLRNKKNSLNSPLNSSTPMKPRGTEKNNDKSFHPVVMIDKNEIHKANRPKKISPEKSGKIEEPRKISPAKSNKKIAEQKKNSRQKPSKKIEEPKKVSPNVEEKQNQRSRSGRTIKPLKSLWTDGSYIFNVNRKSPVKAKSKNETTVIHRDSLDGNRKRKRDNDNDNSNENETKPAKLKKSSPEENKKEHSPVKKSPARRKKKSPPPKRIPEKKNKKSPPRKKSPVKTKSPVRISPVKRQNNQKSKEQNNKIKGKNEKNNSVTASDKKKKADYSALPDYDEFECPDMLDGIELPQISAEERKAQLSKSQLRIATMETPPLQYFSQNLRVLNTTTPRQSPDWQISQHSQSAVRRFGERRAKNFKQKIPTGSPLPVIKNARKSPRIKDLKTVTDWIGDKDVKSPKKRSKLINIVIPSRRQLEDDDESESD